MTASFVLCCLCLSSWSVYMKHYFSKPVQTLNILLNVLTTFLNSTVKYCNVSQLITLLVPLPTCLTLHVVHLLPHLYFIHLSGYFWVQASDPYT